MPEYLSKADRYADSRLWGWGLNSPLNGYTLADGSLSSRSSPVQTIAGGTNWKYISSGSGYRSIGGIKTDGTLWTWGQNFWGNLGDGTITNRSSPVQTIAGGTDWSIISVGQQHAAAIKTDGTLWTWGNNGYTGDLTGGALGDNTVVHRSSPVQTVAGGTNWRFVAGGFYETAAIKTDGTLWVWGLNYWGQLGDGTIISRSSPVQTITGGTNWKHVSVNGHATAIKTDGTLWTWGVNYQGLLGDGTTTDRSSPVQTIAGGTNWSQGSSGASQTAAIKTDGTLWTWGRNYQGVLGDGTTTNRSSPVQTISGGTDWKAVHITVANLVAIKTDGTLWTCGSNYQGVLGDGTLTHRSSPVQTVAGGTNWKQIGSTRSAIFALEEAPGLTHYKQEDDSLFTWGTNIDGVLGSGPSVNPRSSPVQIASSLGGAWKQISMGSSYTAAAIGDNNTLWMWGNNAYGQLGDGTITNLSSPGQTVDMLDNWKQVSVNYTTGAIKTNGTLWVWGFNAYGQLGDGTRTHRSSPVQTIAGGTNWKEVSTSWYMTGAIKTDGTLWTWGSNTTGGLGDGTTINRSSPVQTVAGGTNWKQISVSHQHEGAAAIKTDGTLWLWGRNNYGQLGDGTYEDKSSPIQTIAGGTNWKEVNFDYTTRAIKTDGTLWLWGLNSLGTVGNGTTIPCLSPTQTLAGGNNWKNLGLGGRFFASAIKTDGTLWMWGRNSIGVLTNTPIETDLSSPVQILAGSNTWNLIASSGYGVLAMKTDKSDLGETGYVTKEYMIDVYPSLAAQFKTAGLWTWGTNGGGELADGTNIAHRSSPVQTVAGGTNWKEISSITAIKTDGTLWCWGLNNFGAVGDGTSIHRSSPVQTIAGGTNWKTCSESCGIKTDGTLWVWGWNFYGILGTNNTTNRSSPVQTVAGGTNWKEIVVKNANHATALKTDGTLWTWGFNANGNLGTNNITHRSSPVQTIAGGTDWKTCSASAAIKTDGTLWLWGHNSGGRIGDNTTIHRSSPVQTIAGGTNWKQVSSTVNVGVLVGLTAAIKTDGTLWTWGVNVAGELGDDTLIHRSSPVQTISGGTNWKKVSAGNRNIGAIKTDGTLWVWGQNNWGQLGDDTKINRSSPVQTVAGGTNWKNISTDTTMMAIRDDSEDPF
jgi:alpha-tubulin suppressor-like RCC1 family protein